MENDEAVNEFQTIKFSLKEFSEVNLCGAISVEVYC